MNSSKRQLCGIAGADLGYKEKWGGGGGGAGENKHTAIQDTDYRLRTKVMVHK